MLSIAKYTQLTGIFFIAPELTKLKAVASGICDLGLSFLAALPRLRYLDLSECAEITGPGLLMLQKSKSLQLLNLTDCPSITRDDILRFKAHAPKIKVRSSFDEATA